MRGGVMAQLPSDPRACLAWWAGTTGTCLLCGAAGVMPWRGPDPNLVRWSGTGRSDGLGAFWCVLSALLSCFTFKFVSTSLLLLLLLTAIPAAGRTVLQAVSAAGACGCGFARDLSAVVPGWLLCGGGSLTFPAKTWGGFAPLNCFLRTTTDTPSSCLTVATELTNFLKSSRFRFRSSWSRMKFLKCVSRSEFFTEPPLLCRKCSTASWVKTVAIVVSSAFYLRFVSLHLLTGLKVRSCLCHGKQAPPPGLRYLSLTCCIPAGNPDVCYCD